MYNTPSLDSIYEVFQYIIYLFFEHFLIEVFAPYFSLGMLVYLIYYLCIDYKEIIKGFREIQAKGLVRKKGAIENE